MWKIIILLPFQLEEQVLYQTKILIIQIYLKIVFKTMIFK